MSPASVITISRQMGSLGSAAASQAAPQLGFEVHQRELINQAARRAGAPEAALAELDELGLLGLRPTPEQVQAYLTAVRQVMLELASRGRVIIIGRAGQVILRDHPGVLHLRITAPLAVRAQRIADRQHITLNAALAQVQASDRSRKSYLKRNYQVRWDDPDWYDLTLNTAHLTVEAVAEIICTAARRYT
ncbi:MAG TPA: cytidylate kinase-like family protein [Anaerolineaceae bacterium]|jgi:cytidylate kinase|nr:cytidylate kinase-like family protein [Anaerolineaceae bacterium]